MDKVTMVSIDISTGSDLLDALERAKVKVSVALRASQKGLWLSHNSVAGGFGPKNTPEIMILPTSDPFIRQLR